MLVLLAERPSDADAAAVERLVGMLWDLGLEVGHSVRTIAECLVEAARDVLRGIVARGLGLR